MGCNCGGSAKAKERREARQKVLKARADRQPTRQRPQRWTGPQKTQNETTEQ